MKRCLLSFLWLIGIVALVATPVLAEDVTNPVGTLVDEAVLFTDNAPDGEDFTVNDDSYTNAGDIDIQSVLGDAVYMGVGNDLFVNEGTGSVVIMDTGDEGISLGCDNDDIICQVSYAPFFGDDDTLNNYNSIIIIDVSESAISFGMGDDTLFNAEDAEILVGENDSYALIGMGEGDDTLTNLGSIITYNSAQAGIAFASGNDTLTNAEGASIYIEQGGSGISFASGDDYLENLGAIELFLDLGESTVNMEGITFGSGNDTLINGSAEITSATISTYNTSNGIAFAEGDDSLVNYGTITVENARYYGGITFAEGTDSLTNYGTIDIVYANKAGISFGGGDDTLDNYGTIDVGYSGNAGISFADGDDTLNNYESIILGSADGELGEGGISFGAGDDSLLNAEGASITIYNATGCVGIGFAEGNDTFENYGDVSIGETNNGGITFGSGDDTFINGTADNTDVSVTIADAGSGGITFGGGMDTMVNYGTIDVGYAGDAGMSFASGDDTLDNYGSITLGSTDGELGEGGISFGEGNDSLLNDEGASITIYNTGCVGIGFAEGDDTLENMGTISLGEIYNGGITFGSGDDTLINGSADNTDASISITEAGTSGYTGGGITFGGGMDTLVNYGSIDVEDAYCAGMSFAEGDDTLDNYGTITLGAGDGELGGGGISFAAGNDSLLNAEGASITIYNTGCTGIAFAEGDDTFENYSDVSIGETNNGGITFGSGDDTFINGTADNTDVSVYIADAGKGGITFAEGDDTFINYGTVDVDEAYCAGMSFAEGDDSLENYGAISLGEEGYVKGGISFAEGNDSLLNAEGASITIYNATGCSGMSFGGGDDTFENYGDVSIAETSNGGMTFGGGEDYLYNGADASIYIEDAGSGGMTFAGGTDVLENYGTIVVESAYNGGMSFAGGEDQLNNYGTIEIGLNSTTEATGEIGVEGISFGGGNDTLLNDTGAVISIYNTANYSDRYGAGITFGGGDDSLQNLGEINIEDVNIHGIAMGGGDSELINAGTINIDVVADGDEMDEPISAIVFGGSGSDLFRNEATGVINLGSDTGEIEGGGVLFNADFDVDYLYYYDWDVEDFLLDQGTGEFINEGTINFYNVVGTGIDMGLGHDIVTVSGALNFEEDNEGVAIDGGEDFYYDGSYTTMVYDVPFYDYLYLQGEEDLEINGDVINFEFLYKDDAGSWTINGDADAYNSANVREGTLIVTGPDAETPSTFNTAILTIDAGALFGGNVDVLGDVFNNGGIAPGNSIGTIEVAGDYNQAVGATYYAEVGEDGVSDLISVVDGYNATILDGALLDVKAVDFVETGYSYNVVTVSNCGDLVGGYAQEDVDGSLFLDFEVTNIDGMDGYVHLDTTLLDPADDVGLGAPTVAAIDLLIDNATDGEGDDEEDLDNFLAVLNADSEGEVYDLLGTASTLPALGDAGVVISSAFSAQQEDRVASLHQSKYQQYAADTNRMTDAGPALSRLPAFERTGEGLSGWIRVLATDGSQDDDGALVGYDFDTTGFVLGFDNSFSTNFAAGISFGLGQSDIDFNGGYQSTDADSTFGSLYGTYSTEMIYVDMSLTYASNDFDNDRYAGLFGTAKSSTDGTALGLYVGAGYNLVDTETMYFIPTASVSYIASEVDGFHEKGAGDFNMIVDDYDHDSFRTTLGFRTGCKRGGGDSMMWEPELRLAWVHEFGDDDVSASAVYEGGGDSFEIESVEQDSDAALLGLGANFYLNDAFTLYLDYDGEFRSDFDAHSLSGGLRYNF